jgi:hypothetical protein
MYIWLNYRFLRGITATEMLIAVLFLAVFFSVLYFIAHLIDTRKKR